jgi:ketosteroid isomerase-like protein
MLATTDIQAIEQLHRHWIEAEIQGRGLDVLDYCTEDVRWLVPHSPMLIGKAAARSLLEHPGVQIIDIETDEIEIRGSDRMAYKTCRYQTTFVTTYETAKQVMAGTHLWILDKQAEGHWQVALVTWQPMPSA